MSQTAGYDGGRAAPLRSDRSVLAEWRRTIDWPLLIVCLALIGVGLLLSLAAGPSAAERYGYDNPYYFTLRQSVFAGGAVVVLLGTSLLNAQWARRFCAAVFLGGFLLMAIIALVGHEVGGATRWIRIGGFGLQPSEMIKPALVVLTGWLLAQRNLYPDGPWAVVAFSFYAATLGLLLLQPDVGQAALLTAAFVITFFVSGLPFRWAAGFAAGGAALSAALYALLPHVRARVNSFIFPGAGDTYQVDRAADAIQSGGLFGLGPGEGIAKTRVPDGHTDFIYSVMSNEYGFVAALVLITVFALISVKGIARAARVLDPFPRAAATGLFALFGLQAAINISVNVSLIPPKGMTLPFISYGGSSLIGTALTLGLALALIRGRTARQGPY